MVIYIVGHGVPRIMKPTTTTLSILLLATACSGTKDNDTASDDVSDDAFSDADDSDADTDADADADADGGPIDDGYTADAGPCLDGTWGTISDPTATVHFWGGDVSNAPADGTDSAGGMNTPYVSWDSFEAAREADPTLEVSAVGLWTGEHSIPAATLTELASNDIPILGCGSEEVTIALADAPSEPDVPMIEVGAGMNSTFSGLSLQGSGSGPVIGVHSGGQVTLSAMNISSEIGAPLIRATEGTTVDIDNSDLFGGSTGIWTTGGTTNLSDVNVSSTQGAGIWTTGGTTNLTNVQVSSTQGAGIWTTGGTTNLSGVDISNVSSLPGSVAGRGGWGLVSNGSELVINDITIDGAVHTGIVAAVDVVSIRNVTIRNVVSNSDGQWGRGIYLEGIEAGGYASLQNITIEEVYDAGVFIHNLADTVIENLTVTNVHQHVGEYGDDSYGAEGLVILQSSTEEGTTDTSDGVSVPGFSDLVPADVTVDLVGTNSFTGISRAGIIVDASALNMDTLTEMDAGDTREGVSVFSQNYGVIRSTEPDTDGAVMTESAAIGTCTVDGGENLGVDTDEFDFSAL